MYIILPETLIAKVHSATDLLARFALKLFLFFTEKSVHIQFNQKQVPLSCKFWPNPVKSPSGEQLLIDGRYFLPSLHRF